MVASLEVVQYQQHSVQWHDRSQWAKNSFQILRLMILSVGITETHRLKRTVATLHLEAGERKEERQDWDARNI